MAHRWANFGGIDTLELNGKSEYSQQETTHTYEGGIVANDYELVLATGGLEGLDVGPNVGGYWNGAATRCFWLNHQEFGVIPARIRRSPWQMQDSGDAKSNVELGSSLCDRSQGVEPELPATSSQIFQPDYVQHVLVADQRPSSRLVLHQASVLKYSVAEQFGQVPLLFQIRFNISLTTRHNYSLNVYDVLNIYTI